MIDPQNMTDAEFALYSAGVAKGIDLAIEHGRQWLFVTEFDGNPIVGGFLATESAANSYIRGLTKERVDATK